jgi:hypothetical protein
MSSTILATFDRIDDANNAVRALMDAGFKRGDIGLAVYNPADDTTHVGILNEEDVSGAEGATIGATFGSVFGAVAGLAAIAIPGIGPVIAAGPLAAVLGAAAGAGIGAVSGAVTGGITASLVSFGVPEEDAHYYAESLRRGAALVSVTAHDVDADRAAHILRQHNPIDVDKRVSQWRNRGWAGFDPAVEGYKSEDRVEAENYGFGAEEVDEQTPVAYEDETHPGRNTRKDEEYADAVRRYPSS